MQAGNNREIELNDEERKILNAQNFRASKHSHEFAWINYDSLTWKNRGKNNENFAFWGNASYLMHDNEMTNRIGNVFIMNFSAQF